MTDSSFEDLFKKFSEQAAKQYQTFYEEFAGKYLRIPPLGIGRETIGESMAAGEAYHKLAVAVGEFIQHFSTPLTETLASFQETINKDSDQLDSAEALYAAFMQQLDQKFEAYLHSREGVQEVSALIDQYIEFKNRLDNALEPWMDFYNIPNKKDMQSVYRKLHQLKRKNRALEKTVQEQGTALKTLSERVATMEASGPKPKSVRKKTGTTTRAKTTKRKPAASKTSSTTTRTKTSKRKPASR